MSVFSDGRYACWLYSEQKRSYQKFPERYVFWVDGANLAENNFWTIGSKSEMSNPVDVWPTDQLEEVGVGLGMDKHLGPWERTKHGCYVTPHQQSHFEDLADTGNVTQYKILLWWQINNAGGALPGVLDYILSWPLLQLLGYHRKSKLCSLATIGSSCFCVIASCWYALPHLYCSQNVPPHCTTPPSPWGICRDYIIRRF